MDATSLIAESVPKKCEYLLTGIVCSGVGALMSVDPDLEAESLCSQVLSYAG